MNIAFVVWRWIARTALERRREFPVSCGSRGRGRMWGMGPIREAQLQRDETRVQKGARADRIVGERHEDIGSKKDQDSESGED